MRTTLTIEDDVAARLLDARSRSDQSLKSVINTTLRAGLDQLDKVQESSLRHYVVKPAVLGKNLPDLDNIAEILALDDPDV